MGVVVRFMEIAFLPGCQVDLRHNMPLRLCGNAISQLQQGSLNSFETTNLKIGQRKLGETKLVKSINIDLPFKKKNDSVAGEHAAQNILTMRSCLTK